MWIYAAIHQENINLIGKWDTESNSIVFHYNEREYSVTEIENVLIERAKEIFNEGDKVIEENESIIFRKEVDNGRLRSHVRKRGQASYSQGVVRSPL